MVDTWRLLPSRRYKYDAADPLGRHGARDRTKSRVKRTLDLTACHEGRRGRGKGKRRDASKRGRVADGEELWAKGRGSRLRIKVRSAAGVMAGRSGPKYRQGVLHAAACPSLMEGEPVVDLSFKVDQASDLPRAVWRYRNVTGSTLQSVNALQVLATCQAGLIRI